MKCLVAVTCVLSAWMLPVSAATLERLSLDDMIAKSTGIVRGTIAAAWTLIPYPNRPDRPMFGMSFAQN